MLALPEIVSSGFWERPRLKGIRWRKREGHLTPFSDLYSTLSIHKLTYHTYMHSPSLPFPLYHTHILMLFVPEKKCILSSLILTLNVFPRHQLTEHGKERGIIPKENKPSLPNNTIVPGRTWNARTSRGEVTNSCVDRLATPWKGNSFSGFLTGSHKNLLDFQE